MTTLIAAGWAGAGSPDTRTQIAMGRAGHTGIQTGSTCKNVPPRKTVRYSMPLFQMTLFHYPWSQY